MGFMNIIIKKIDDFTNWVGKIASWSVILLMLLVVFEVVMRRVFSSPTIWTFESITMVFGFHFMFVAGYALLHKSLVSVDILYERFSKKTKAVLDLVTYVIFFFPFVISLLYLGYQFAADSWVTKEISSSLWGPPLYPFKTIIPIAMSILALQGISEVFKRILILVTEDKEYD